MKTLSKHPVREVCNREQKSYLLTELGKLNRSRYDWDRDDLPPALERLKATAKRIEKRLAAFNRKSEKRRDRESNAWAANMANVRKVIHFGTPDEALKALEALQAEYKRLFGKAAG